MNKRIYVALLLLAIAAMVAYPVIAAKDNNAADNAKNDAGPDTDTVSTVAMSNGGAVSPGKEPTTPAKMTLASTKTYANANYVTAGIGVRNTGRGTVNLRLPSGATIIDAWVYWKVLNSAVGGHDADITVNGVRIKGTSIGSGPSPCWSGNGYGYKANIKNTLYYTSLTGGSFGTNIGGISSAVYDGRSPWAAFALPSAEDAQVVIIFKDPSNPTSTVTISDGYNEFSGGIVSAGVPTGTTMFSSLIGDGQVVGVTPYTKSVDYTDSTGTTTLQKVTLNGKDPSIASRATYQGSLSDTDTYILPSAAPAGATLTWNLAEDCVVYDALIFTDATNIP